VFLDSTFMQLWTLPETYISLLSLTLLEVVLGIDNIIFISILAGRLPVEQQRRARVMGLMVALVARFILLGSIAWVVQLTQPWIQFWGLSFSGKDLILLSGGIFLVWKSAQEIYEKVEHSPSVLDPHATTTGRTVVTLKNVIFQIVLVDMVFSIDSIITAVGLVDHVAIMVVAILISMTVMIASAHHIAGFVDRHPSVKILALSFLLMIGTLLTAEAFHMHVPKAYVYASLVFALFVEFLNIKAHSRERKLSSHDITH
jgi:predicted tellurium resistance membrane protein TerC